MKQIEIRIDIPEQDAVAFARWLEEQADRIGERKGPLRGRTLGETLAVVGCSREVATSILEGVAAGRPFLDSSGGVA